MRIVFNYGGKKKNNDDIQLLTTTNSLAPRHAQTNPRASGPNRQLGFVRFPLKSKGFLSRAQRQPRRLDAGRSRVDTNRRFVP